MIENQLSIQENRYLHNLLDSSIEDFEIIPARYDRIEESLSISNHKPFFSNVISFQFSFDVFSRFYRSKFKEMYLVACSSVDDRSNWKQQQERERGEERSCRTIRFVAHFVSGSRRDRTIGFSRELANSSTAIDSLSPRRSIVSYRIFLTIINLIN